MIIALLIQISIINYLWGVLSGDEHQRAVQELHQSIYDRGFKEGCDATLASVKHNVLRWHNVISRSST